VEDNVRAQGECENKVDQMLALRKQLEKNLLFVIFVSLHEHNFAYF
jgi:hypothetical protein